MGSRDIITIVFALMALTSFGLIYLIPPSTQILFPAFQHVRDTGTYPDGLTIRRNYTGIRLLDEVFTGLAGFFSAAVDGEDEATRMFCLWFLPQLCGILVFLYWEAGRATSRSLVSRPTLFGVLAQLVTAGVTLPLYFIVHLRDIPLIPGGLAPDSVSRARTIFPAITVGFLLPSGILFLFPANAGLSLDTKQIIAAVWQPFPLYIGAALAISRVWDFISRRHLESGANDLLAKSKVAATRDEMAFAHLRRSYLASALLSTIAHWAIVIPSLVTTKTSLSFAQIFIPYSLHSYFSVAPSPLAAYRLSIRLLFQNDWFTMTVAALVFFGWIHVELDKALPSGEQTGLFRWLAKVTFLTMLGGPGAAIAWAAVSREGYMMALSQRARDRTLEARVPEQHYESTSKEKAVSACT